MGRRAEHGARDADDLAGFFEHLHPAEVVAAGVVEIGDGVSAEFLQRWVDLVHISPDQFDAIARRS